MIRILVLEPLSHSGLELLRKEAEFEVLELYRPSPTELDEALREAQVLLVRSKTHVTDTLMGKAGKLKLIARPGTGIDNIDLGAATRRGIIVMNTPASNSISAAEHSLGLMLSLLRKIPAADRALKEGKWEREIYQGRELCGKVLGILGFGRIGIEVAKRAKAFEMEILVCDPYVSDSVARDFGVRLVGLDELLGQSEILTLHLPLNSGTRNVLNAASISKMRHGSYLINAARGGLVDEAALIRALAEGKLAGAALDVFAQEPNPNPELVRMPTVISTPHLGASTAEAQEKVGQDIALQIGDFFREGIVRNAVNFPSISKAEYGKAAPYLELGGKLGRFAGQIAAGRMRELTVRYYGELADMDTRLIGCSVLAGFLQPILSEPVNLVSAVERARERGIHFAETRSTRRRDFTHLISVKLWTDAGEEWVEGAILQHNQHRLVSLHGINVDAPLRGVMLIIQNHDTPGVIGRVGTLLGESGINIANFALGRQEEASRAIGIVNLDSEVPERVLSAIRALPQIQRVRCVAV